jgi:hypothetical protein
MYNNKNENLTVNPYVERSVYGMGITDEMIIEHIGKLMTNLKKNEELQALAKQNGLDVKNTIDFKDSTIENISVSIVALLLAKRENDPKYKQLVDYGMQKRSLKTDLINTYKNQAIQFINMWKNNQKALNV